MSSAPTADEIWSSARWLAQAVDPGAGLLRLVEMTPTDYRDASFLDDRMFVKQRASHLLKWDKVAEALPANARRDARWILHIGHVGSTLIARLLGELDGVLAVREPRALRDLTFFPPDVRARFVPTLQALMARTFEAAATHPGRRGLSSRGITLEEPRNETEAAAVAWACEMTALEAAAGGNCLWADFDDVLGELEPSLREMADFFGFAASDGQLQEIARGPLIRRYSKATEHEYSPQLRRDLLAEAAHRNRTDIESALAMLDAASETAPLLRKALDRAKAES